MQLTTLLTLTTATLASAGAVVPSQLLQERQEGPSECDKALPCNPGQYCCYNRGDTYVIQVCTSQRRWTLSSECGAIGCCESGVGDTKFCTC
ncbi:predicted protein [Chaetomium globosum CBS 148.51]|uniref:Uncharacterized protein n=1 Tax=Chaetomium globosum (strain ATCC 6205 / CBS 148.51 / DSM 1962 / NBRC 6347 / NRRL 1970) TaxID=306901 RepID=Q2HHL9_CHAGB|nr:uncharacterized protein CHGG_00285 [Chaetomium globosum CBS 148.51]EAQ92050.1 predicted protein [Chaetomium globosum CBS 148.51]